MQHTIRERRTLAALEALTTDVRSAIRSLRHAPGFAAAVVLMLATGIAATISAFTIVNATVFASAMPGIVEPERLVDVGLSSQSAGSAFGRIDHTYDEFVALERGIPAVSLSARTDVRVVVAIDGVPQAVSAGIVSENSFDVLGMPFMAGRGFARDASSANDAVV